MKRVIVCQTMYGERFDPGIDCSKDKIVVEQSHAADCDIDTILKKYSKTGILPESKTPMYGDYTNVPDYMAAQAIVLNAKQQYDNLDPKIRNRLRNPLEFLEFVSDPKNHEEMVSLGLANKKASNDQIEANNKATVSSAAPSAEVSK